MAAKKKNNRELFDLATGYDVFPSMECVFGKKMPKDMSIQSMSINLYGRDCPATLSVTFYCERLDVINAIKSVTNKYGFVKIND